LLRLRGTSTAFIAAFALVAFSWAGTARGAGIDALPALQVHITTDLGIDRLFDAASMGCEQASGTPGFTGSCQGYNYDLGGLRITSLSVEFVLDPEVHVNVALRNTSAFVQTITLETTLPTVFGGPNVMGGSVGGSLTESNGGGSGASLVVPVGSALYTALVDGGAVAQLLAAPYSLTVANNFETATVPATAFGQPIPNAPAPGVASSIGLRLNFQLSPGDQVALSSVFVLEALQTPEPALGAVLGALGLGLVALRSRRV